MRRRDRRSTLFAVLALVNGAAWIWAWVAFADRPALLGSAFLAWTFGLRHAVDPDHIAAIDNVVRKLIQEGRRTLATGLWFSLGHSTIVVLASLAVAGAASAMPQRLEGWRAAGALVGTTVSAAFLLGIGLVNVVILRGLWRAFRQIRRGEVQDGVLDAALAQGGLVARLCRPLFHAVRRSWHMYPVGLLFGLGFDTATEIGVLGIAGLQAHQGMSPWAVMVFPALFTAGMTLVDTADSVLMTGAYGWAFVDPLRKLWYNLTMTVVSILVASLIGGLEVLGLAGRRIGLDGPFWHMVEDADNGSEMLGMGVIGLFALCWMVSALLYRAKRYGVQA